MTINWKIRIQSLEFWTDLIPAILLLIQAVGAPLGLQLDFGELGNQLLAIVNAVFAVMTILGIIKDPTTKGLSDSARALTYTEKA